MSPALLYFVALIYAGIALQYMGVRRYGMAMVFIAYALANIGFALDTQ